jgi:hypothetical protein
MLSEIEQLGPMQRPRFSRTEEVRGPTSTNATRNGEWDQYLEQLQVLTPAVGGKVHAGGVLDNEIPIAGVHSVREVRVQKVVVLRIHRFDAALDLLVSPELPRPQTNPPELDIFADGRRLLPSVLPAGVKTFLEVDGGKYERQKEKQYQTLIF